MPLFMDLHKASDYDTKPTVEEIKKNHIADLAVQHKYNVRFLQYWINEDDGMVFCLMEAPDKESCAAVHREAHGAMPCNVIELQGGDYAAFLNNGTRKNEFDIVEMSDGSLDAGYRAIMVIDYFSLTNQTLPLETTNMVNENGGKILQRPGSRLTVLFTTAIEAFTCAQKIINHTINKHEKGNEIRIGISAGSLVTDRDQLFGDAVLLANRCCDIAHSGCIVSSSLANELAEKNNTGQRESLSIKPLTAENELFLNNLSNSISTHNGDAVHIDQLTRKLGISRSQLYRKMKELTGGSPNAFLQELRLQKAVQLIKEKYGNITQVALEAGFTNLSYFAKTFQQRYGIPPLKFSKLYS